MKSFIKYTLPFLPFFFFLIGYILSNLLVGTSTYIAPNLIGLTIYDAVKHTSHQHLNIQLISEKECFGINPGTILAQKPSPGRLIKRHQSILVTTAKLPQTTLASSYTGKTIDSIKKSCKQDNIKIKDYSLVYPFPQGTCIAQIPQPEQPIINKKLILYTAKNQSNMYLMPNYINKNITDAIHSLKQYPMPITIIHNNQIISTPEQKSFMKIVAQKPLAGSLITLNNNLSIQLEVQYLL